MKNKYVLLEGIANGNKFFTLNSHRQDNTKLANGDVAYNLLGYANTIADAQMQLFGYVSTDCKD